MAVVFVLLHKCNVRVHLLDFNFQSARELRHVQLVRAIKPETDEDERRASEKTIELLLGSVHCDWAIVGCR